MNIISIITLIVLLIVMLISEMGREMLVMFLELSIVIFLAGLVVFSIFDLIRFIVIKLALL